MSASEPDGDGERAQRAGAAAALPLLFATAVVVLLLSGSGRLAAPPLADLDGWADDVGPIVATIALLRLAALVAAGWMFVATLVAAGARLAGADAIAGAVDRALPAPLRGALAGLAGVGVAGVVAVSVTTGPEVGAAATAAPIERLVRLPADPPAPPPTETMSVLPEEPASSPATAAPATAGPVGDEWTVAPGDSFWSIAEDVLGDRFGRPASDAEVARYWRTVIETNRDRLVSADVDLLYPGQVFVLPA